MKVLFCNITYMNNYMGITEDDMPHKGGAWVQKHKDANEQWNFLNYNGFCYGFAMNKGNQIFIERIDKSANKSDSIDGVTVFWCASNESNETVIVGWYENATVYRYYRDILTAPNAGIEHTYFVKANADDCYLLPENLRTFKVGRASREGKGKGIGQQNYWFAESAYARTELIPAAISFLEDKKQHRINRINSDFDCPELPLAPLTPEEDELAKTLFEEDEDFRYLPLGYRKFYHTNDADTAYYIADSLRFLHQYDKAITWYKKVIEIEGPSWNTNAQFPYLYQLCEKFKESTESALELTNFPEAKDPNILHEIYSIIADNCYNQDKIEEGISWLDKIIAQSENESLLTHTKYVKDYWLSLI